MSTLRWIGNAQAVACVYQATIGTNDASTTYGVTINGKTVSAVGQSTTSLSVAALLAALQLASGQTSGGTIIPEFSELTWSSPSADVIGGTANTAGVPVTIDLDATGGTGTWAAGFGDTTAPNGPNYWDNDGDWDTGTPPTNGDTVYVDNTSESILYNISQGDIAPALLSIGANFTGQIGLPQYNTSNVAGAYREYRPTALNLSLVKLEIGSGSGVGSSLIRINTNTAACSAIIYGTGSPSGTGAEPGVPAVVLDMDSTTSTLEVLSGSVGLGCISKAANVVGSVSIGQATQQASLGPANFQTGGAVGTDVLIGPNVQIVSATSISGGNVLIDTTAGAGLGTTISVYGGTLEVIGVDGITNLNVYGGTCYWSSTGTIVNALVGPGGTLDFSQDLQAKAITNPVQMSAGATLNDPFGVVSSLAIKTVNCTLAQVTVSLGFNHTLTRS